MDVDSSNPEIMENVVIEDVQMERGGNVVVDYRTEGILDSVCLPGEGVTLSFLRRLRKWKHNRTPLSVQHNEEEGFFQICSQVPDDDRITEALDSVQQVYIALQDVREGLESLVGIAQQTVLMDPVRGVVNRYLR